jgi:aquaporin Z
MLALASTKSGPFATWREHWPEYLIEGWALGSFMLSASVVTVVLECPTMPLRGLIADSFQRRVLVGVAMGLTAVALIYSRWGRRSGAHMNPAVTLAFVRLGLVRPIDGMFYIASQILGGALGIVTGYLLTGGLLASPEVNWVATVPGSGGPLLAGVLEFAMSLALMLVVLRMSASARFGGLAGIAAGLMVTTFIIAEAPQSGMSINPARSLASALPSGIWTAFWIYLLASPLGMLAAAELHRWTTGGRPGHCAKLMHDDSTPCIHCGHRPTQAADTPTLPVTADIRGGSHV